MNLLKSVFLALIISGISISAISADPVKGQKIFIKKFKKACGFNGAEFAIKHSQNEWKEIMQNNKFKEEFIKICPNVKEETIKDKWIQDLYDFSYEYANDSGNVPSC